MQRIEDLLNDPSRYHIVTEEREVFVMETSDGFIPEGSQLFDGRLDEYKAYGVNHREELDASADNITPSTNDEMEIQFNNIWNRPFDDFFYTEERF